MDELGDMGEYDMMQDDQTAASGEQEETADAVPTEPDHPASIVVELRIRQLSPTSPGHITRPPGSSIWFVAAPAIRSQITRHPQAGELINTALGLRGWIPGRLIDGTNTMFAALIES